MAKPRIPKIDLSKYESQERLPSNVVNIIKNALCVFEGNSNKVANHFNLKKETVDMILEENFLQITQIIENQMKSKELNRGIENAILLITDHVTTIQKNKSTPLMTKSTITDVTKMTDRLVSLKDQYNKTYDQLVNKMHEQALKERMVSLQENGKPTDDSEYQENQQIVANMMQTYLDKKKDKKVTLVNVKTFEIKVFEGPSARIDAEQFLGCPNHLTDVSRQKNPYKGEWIVNYDKGD